MLRVTLGNCQSLQEIARFNIDEDRVLGAMSWFYTSQLLAVGGSVYIWIIDATNPTAPTLVSSKTTGSPIMSLACNRLNDSFGAGRLDGTLLLWDNLASADPYRLKGHRSGVGTVTFTRRGDHLASAGTWDATIRIWDVDTHEEEFVLKDTDGESVLCLSFAPHENALVSGNLNNKISLWDMRTRTKLQTVEGHSAGVFTLLFNSAGTLLASGDIGETVHLWDTTNWTQLAALKHPHGTCSLTFTMDGTILASGGIGDGRIHIWDVERHIEMISLMSDSRGAINVSFSPDDTVLVSAGEDGLIQFWGIPPV